MHWTGTGTAVRSAEEAESGPLSVMPVRTRRSLSGISGRRTARIVRPAESLEPLPHGLFRPPGLTIALAPRQIVVTAALVALTSLATAVVMAQGVRHLDTSPGPETTPYLADAPRGPVRVPPLDPIGGSGASVPGDVSNQVGPVSPDRKGPAGEGVPGPLSGKGSRNGALPDSVVPGMPLDDPTAGTGPYDPHGPDTVVGGVLPGGNGTGTGPLIGGGGPLGGPLFRGLLPGRHWSGPGTPPGHVPHDRGAGHRRDTVPTDRPPTADRTLAGTTSEATTSPTTSETMTSPITVEATVDIATAETADSSTTLSDTGTAAETETSTDTETFTDTGTATETATAA